eukprot:1194085-Prorocentrum_minimum.AAC.2
MADQRDRFASGSLRVHAWLCGDCRCAKDSLKVRTWLRSADRYASDSLRVYTWLYRADRCLRGSPRVHAWVCGVDSGVGIVDEYGRHGSMQQACQRHGDACMMVCGPYWSGDTTYFGCANVG